MKKYCTLILLLCIISAQSFANKPDWEDGTKLNLWIPGFLVKMAGNIAEDYADEEIPGDLISKFGSITICIREGEKYAEHTDKKVTRKINRLNKKNYEPLVRVREESTTVDIRIKENKRGVIKRFVCIVDEKDETFVYVKMNCRLKPKDLAKLVDEATDDLMN